jgi:hypothetical protein
MGSSDPLPVGFEIRFGSLNFQATGNGYLMRITNCDELRARRQTGSSQVPVAHVAGTPTPASTDAAGPSAPRRRRRSGQRSRKVRTERRRAARTATQGNAPTGRTTATPTGERSVSGPRFPLGLRALRRRTWPPPILTRRREGFALAAMFWPPGAPAVPLTMNRPTAPPASCHPPLRTGTRSGTSSGCRTE